MMYVYFQCTIANFNDRRECFKEATSACVLSLKKSTLNSFLDESVLNKLPIRACDLGEGVGRCTDIGVCCA